jgi:hypothetical protein
VTELDLLVPIKLSLKRTCPPPWLNKLFDFLELQAIENSKNMGAIEIMAPHVFAVAINNHELVGIAFFYDHLKLLLSLVVLHSVNSIRTWSEQLRLELGRLSKGINLLVLLILYEESMTVHKLEKHLFEGPARIDLVNISKNWVVNDELDLTLAFNESTLNRL